MNFDDVWLDDSPAAAAELPLAPNGVLVGRIVAVEDGTKPWLKNDANPNGRCLSVSVEVPGFAIVDEHLPAHYRGKIGAVCRSAGVAEPTRGKDWDETQLVGRPIGILAERRTAKSGRDYVTVARWYSAAEAADHPSPEPAAAPTPPPPKAPPAAVARATRKPKTEPTNDDIPF